MSQPTEIGNVLPTREHQRIETFAVIARERSERECRSDVPAAELAGIVITAMFDFLFVETEWPDERRRTAHRMQDLLILGSQ